MQKILVMGLPGSGKTFFSQSLKTFLENNQKTVQWFNADDVRRNYNDWDFSLPGRIRQSKRMYELAWANDDKDFVICDFVAPLQEMRNNFAADWVVWIDTIEQGRFEDTNKMFVPPDVYDFRITEQNADKWAEFVGYHLLENRRRPVFDWKKETVQMLGRGQPWHAGHRALFERAIAKTGQVAIMIRDCQGWNGSNPFAENQVRNFIQRDLDPIFQGQFIILLVPNIVNITYGRDVGYKIEQEVFDEKIHSISATKIRKEMGIE
jgi:hypothetical protein